MNRIERLIVLYIVPFVLFAQLTYIELFDQNKISLSPWNRSIEIDSYRFFSIGIKLLALSFLLNFFLKIKFGNTPTFKVLNSFRHTKSLLILNLMLYLISKVSNIQLLETIFFWATLFSLDIQIPSKRIAITGILPIVLTFLSNSKLPLFLFFLKLVYTNRRSFLQYFIPSIFFILGFIGFNLYRNLGYETISLLYQKEILLYGISSIFGRMVVLDGLFTVIYHFHEKIGFAAIYKNINADLVNSVGYFKKGDVLGYAAGNLGRSFLIDRDLNYMFFIGYLINIFLISRLLNAIRFLLPKINVICIMFGLFFTITGIELLFIQIIFSASLIIVIQEFLLNGIDNYYRRNR